MTDSPQLVYPTGSEPRAELGEGLVLFPDSSLYWVDLLGGVVYRADGDGHTREATYPHEVAKVLPWQHGSIVLGRVGLVWRNAALESVGALRLNADDSGLRCSDGAVLPDGTLVLGIMDREMAAGRGRFVHIGHRGEVSTLVDRTSVSNGVAVLPGGRELVWTDSSTQTIFVLDIDRHSGIPGAPRVFAEIPGSWGVPDGLAADSLGGVWVALWGGGAVRRLDAGGSLTHTLEVPVPHVTSVAFDAADNLLVTTAAVLLGPDERRRLPGAGGVWRWSHDQHGFHGLPVIPSTTEPPAQE